MGRASLPASPATVAAYVGSLADELAPRSMGVALAAIAAFHRAAGVESPCSDPTVRYVIRGHRRTRGMGARRVHAIRIVELREMIPRGDAAIDVRDRALLLVGFAAALRRSELVALDRADLEFVAEGLIVTIRQSKTDGEGHGAQIGIPYGRDPGLCAVRALRAWLDHPLGVEDDPAAVFRRVAHGRGGVGRGRLGRRLSDRAVALVVKRRGAVAGLQIGEIAGHSLRAGFATEAAANEVSEEAICRQTRHRSAVVRDYIRFGRLFIANPAGRIL
jgi:site-specific recombinase XerC